MDDTDRHALELALRDRRTRLWQEATAADADLLALGERRESEIEEAAQEERLARVMETLDLRAKHEIEAIDAALMRLADGRYGTCLSCGAPIALARLRALPAARDCMRCAAGRA